ncbi:hypothetical protein QAD02_005582 [Eretmocerus hayati]|uniref:Uncharacterized protein n=1 Tax=Eretmocerus hayati TaxID=131215 RepID=A0ACC2NSQ0_9HYME|nr:hypothetical protein QAD02_005582 [Eretmocerus hayati]
MSQRLTDIQLTGASQRAPQNQHEGREASEAVAGSSADQVGVEQRPRRLNPVNNGTGAQHPAAPRDFRRLRQQQPPRHVDNAERLPRGHPRQKQRDPTDGNEHAPAPPAAARGRPRQKHHDPANDGEHAPPPPAAARGRPRQRQRDPINDGEQAPVPSAAARGRQRQEAAHRRADNELPARPELVAREHQRQREHNVVEDDEFELQASPASLNRQHTQRSIIVERG